MTDADLFEQIRMYLPPYLNPTQHHQLFEELRNHENIVFYLNDGKFEGELLQGDGWRGFVAIDFETLQKKTVSGVILSNTCDIAPENERHLPVSILFSPLLRFRKLESTLRGVGLGEEQVASRLDGLRKQKTTSAMFFPQKPGVIEDSVILLDNIHRQPLQNFIANERSQIFKLTQAAFYLFIIKMAIHLTRINEGVVRF